MIFSSRYREDTSGMVEMLEAFGPLETGGVYTKYAAQSYCGHMSGYWTYSRTCFLGRYGVVLLHGSGWVVCL